MELGLVGKFYGTQGGEGQGDFFHKFCGKAQRLKGGKLILQFLSAGGGVDETVLGLKIAVDGLAQLPKSSKGGFVGLQVSGSGFRAGFCQQFVVNETMLGCDLGCGVFGDAAGNSTGFSYHAADPAALQLPGAEQACHTAADDQHVSADMTGKGGKMG